MKSKEETAYSQECDESNLLCDTLAHRDQRSLVFNLLYAIDAFDYSVSLESIADNFERGFNITIDRHSAVFEQAASIVEHKQKLDEHIQPLLDNWRFERLGTATRLILRIAIWELLYTKTDAIVIINEAVELAKCFAEKDAYKFINGVLDEFVKTTRSI